MSILYVPGILMNLNLTEIACVILLLIWFVPEYSHVMTNTKYYNHELRLDLIFLNCIGKLMY